MGENGRIQDSMARSGTKTWLSWEDCRKTAFTSFMSNEGGFFPSPILCVSACTTVTTIQPKIYLLLQQPIYLPHCTGIPWHDHPIPAYHIHDHPHITSYHQLYPFTSKSITSSTLPSFQSASPFIPNDMIAETFHQVMRLHTLPWAKFVPFSVLWSRFEVIKKSECCNKTIIFLFSSIFPEGLSQDVGNQSVCSSLCVQQHISVETHETSQLLYIIMWTFQQYLKR